MIQADNNGYYAEEAAMCRKSERNLTRRFESMATVVHRSIDL